MTAASLPRERFESRFLVEWVVATSIGWLVGFTICEIIEAILDFFANFSLGSLGLSGGVDGIVLGGSMGIAQWIVLNRKVPRAGWWILATIVGFVIVKVTGGGITSAVDGALGVVLTGALLGAALGVPQWLVLDRGYERAARWILMSTLTWGVAWPVGVASDLVLTSGSGWGFFVGALIGGALGGWSLTRLFHDRRA